MNDRDQFVRTTVATLIWLAAFFWAVGIFTSTRKFIDLDPPDTTVVGRMTIENASKAEDYVRAAYFFIGVPFMTVGLAPLLRRYLERSAAGSENRPILTASLFAAPFICSPLVYVITRKELWSVLVVPLVAGIAAFVASRSSRPLISSLAERGTVVLLVTEALALVGARYLYTGRWIAHIHTLLLELVFIALFVLIFTALAGILATRLAGNGGPSSIDRLRQFAVGMSPLLLTPLFALIPATSVVHGLGVTAVALALTVTLLVADVRFTAHYVSRAAIVAVPLAIYVILFGSIASLSEWVDLFHRGESLGPASDYLRGQRPYTEVLPLHGLLEDGMLDAWLMTLFGRSEAVAFNRAQTLTTAMIPLLWILSWQIFRSHRLAAAATILSLIIAADNQRAVPVIATVILLSGGIERRSTARLILAGVVAGASLFFSLETGVYALAGSLIAIAAVAILDGGRSGRDALRAAGFFAAGALAGAAPFIIYLAARESVGAFFHASFVTIPSVIDPAWSLPYPDIGRWFATNASEASVFEMARQLRYLFNPAVIVVALTWMVVRLRHRLEPLTHNQLAIVILAPVATLSQRSALGRADFNHQWFSAFLIAPLAVALIVELYHHLKRTRLLDERPIRVLTATTAILLVPLVMLALWTPGLLNQRLDSLVEYRTRAAGLAVDRAGVESRQRITAVTHAIHQLVSEDETLFDFSNQPAFYFYADRPNPTRFYQVPIMSPDAHQREAIADLEARPPSAILMSAPERYDRFDGVTNAQRAQLVHSWITEHYQPNRVVHGVEIWTRSRRGIRHEGDPLPHERLSFGERELVIPLVLRDEGADRLRWSTDLLFVSRELERTASVLLELRDSAGTSKTTVRVPPGEQRLFLDFLKGLLDREVASGPLFITIEQDALLDVYYRASDSTGDRTSWSRALGFADRSGSHLDFPGLMIRNDERVNVAIVNIGNGTAVVDLFVETGADEERGHRLTIPEASSALAVDVESLVGLRPGPDHPLRAFVVRGVVAGSASVVDPHTRRSEVIAGVPRAR